MKISNVSLSRYLKVEVFLYGSLILASGLIAVNEFRKTAHFADLLQMNVVLSAGDGTNAKVVGRLAAEADQVTIAKECRSDILRAGLSFVMRDLDLQDAVNRYDQWAASMGRANRYVLHALSCNPADGDMWVRLALVSQAISENPQQLSDFMAQSVLLSPSEMHTLSARFVIWKKAGPFTLSLSQKSIERDLRTLLNYANPGEIVDILGVRNADQQTYGLITPGSKLNPYIVSASQLLPRARKAYLDSTGIRLPSGS